MKSKQNIKQVLPNMIGIMADTLCTVIDINNNKLEK